MKGIALTIISVLLAIAIIMAGGTKLMGAETHLENFARWGYPSWFMYVTGLVEVIAAILLVIPATRFYGAALVAPTMIGAASTHIYAGDPPNTVIMPVVLFVLAIIILWNERFKIFPSGGLPTRRA